MTAHSKTLLTTACAACLVLCSMSQAHAWDTAPWNPLPFDQSSQLDANARAKVARVESAGMARAGAARGANSAASPSTSALITNGSHGCAVSLGTVVLPQGVQGSTDVVTNVKVNGDVITVCR